MNLPDLESIHNPELRMAAYNGFVLDKVMKLVMGSPLTSIEFRIYDIIQRYQEENGYSPSIGEIGDLCGLSSPATVHYHLSHLKEKGLVDWNRNEKRTIRIVRRVG